MKQILKFWCCALMIAVSIILSSSISNAANMQKDNTTIRRAEPKPQVRKKPKISRNRKFVLDCGDGVWSEYYKSCLCHERARRDGLYCKCPNGSKPLGRSSKPWMLNGRAVKFLESRKRCERYYTMEDQSGEIHEIVNHYANLYRNDRCMNGLEVLRPGGIEVTEERIERRWWAPNYPTQEMLGWKYLHYNYLCSCPHNDNPTWDPQTKTCSICRHSDTENYGLIPTEAMCACIDATREDEEDGPYADKLAKLARGDEEGTIVCKCKDNAKLTEGKCECKNLYTEVIGQNSIHTCAKCSALPGKYWDTDNKKCEECDDEVPYLFLGDYNRCEYAQTPEHPKCAGDSDTVINTCPKDGIFTVNGTCPQCCGPMQELTPGKCHYTYRMPSNAVKNGQRVSINGKYNHCVYEGTNASIVVSGNGFTPTENYCYPAFPRNKYNVGNDSYGFDYTIPHGAGRHPIIFTVPTYMRISDDEPPVYNNGPAQKIIHELRDKIDNATNDGLKRRLWRLHPAYQCTDPMNRSIINQTNGGDCDAYDDDDHAWRVCMVNDLSLKMRFTYFPNDFKIENYDDCLTRNNDGNEANDCTCFNFDDYGVLQEMPIPSTP